MSTQLSRKEIADGLKKAAIGYWVKLGYGCNLELGLSPWGKHKADLVAINRHGKIVVAEIKSCHSDFSTDSKWTSYLQFCDKFYLVFTEKHWEQRKYELPDRVGVMVLGKLGKLVCVKRAKEVRISGKQRKDLVLRIAWRNATFSARNTKQYRVYLET